VASPEASAASPDGHVHAQTSRTVLEALAELAVRSTPGATAASVTLMNGETPITFVATAAVAVELDESQYERGYGPCLDAILSGDVMYVEDSRTETRWPGYVDAAAASGMLSSLSMPIPVTAGLAAGLNVYAGAPAAFGEPDRDSIARLVEFAGGAIANLQLVEASRLLVDQMQTAMQSRAVIDQARGILMALHGCDADEAFAILRTTSQRANRKLRDIAQEIVNQAARS
jgi:hypothetical protein